MIDKRELKSIWKDIVRSQALTSTVISKTSGNDKNLSPVSGYIKNATLCCPLQTSNLC
jgi:hypothetical protein